MLVMSTVPTDRVMHVVNDLVVIQHGEQRVKYVYKLQPGQNMIDPDIDMPIDVVK